LDTYGLIGYPLSHSFSKKYFTDKFSKENINAQFNNYELKEIADFPKLIEANPNLKGLCVTIPYKEKIIDYLDFVEEEAAEIGAVNCIKKYDGKLYGFNTDAWGIIKTLIHQKFWAAMVLGTGGAAKAVNYCISQVFETPLINVSRTAKENAITYKQIDEQIMKEVSLIVNATPLGTFPNVQESPNIPYHLLNESHTLFDLTYNPPETEFMKKGKAQGATVVNGYDMLVTQAEKAWQNWTDI